MRNALLVDRSLSGGKSRRAFLAFGLCAVVFGALALAAPAHAAPVYLARSECRKGFWHVVTYDISNPNAWVEVSDEATTQPCNGGTPPEGTGGGTGGSGSPAAPAAGRVYQTKQECRGGYWHVVTYDITDPNHSIEVEDLPTSQPCGGSATTENPEGAAGVALAYQYQDKDGPGRLIIADGRPDPASGQIPIDVVLYQNGQVFGGAGYKQLIRQDPSSVSDGVSVYQLSFTLEDRSGRAYELQGRLQVGGLLGAAQATGEYQQEGGDDRGTWQIAAGPPRPLKFHIHPAVNWLGGCSWLAHDPGCAALGPEFDCEPITMGVNKGKYLCFH